MSITKKLVTSNFNVDNASNFINSFSDGNDYFMFAGRHIPYPDTDNNITAPNNSTQSSTTDIYNNMIFSKRIESTDVIQMIPNYAWVSNTAYTQYDHRDGDLLTKQFYTVVNDSTEYNVWKCIHSGSNSTFTNYSTEAPVRTGSAADLLPIETGDGYTWKYMYTISKTDYNKFATKTYVPITANTDVIAGATVGSIEFIDVVNSGVGYDNYISSGTFKTGDISVGGVNTIYGAPEDAVAIDDYYQGCVIKITNGPAAEEYRRIVNYVGVGAQKIFILDRPFNHIPLAGNTYEVYPYIFVWGDGSESTPAEGRALIDSTSANSISKIEMLNVGAGYRYAQANPSQMPDTLPITIDSVYIELPAAVTNDPKFEPAVLVPILPPPGGHGSDPWNELGANRVCLSTKFIDSESGTIPTQNDFRQVGIIKNPLYTNVDLILKGANTVGGVSDFKIGETVYQFKQFKLCGNVNITSSSNTITKTNFGKLSTTATIVNAGVGYNSATNTIVFNNSGTGGTGGAATFVSNISTGAIESVTVTNQGSGYASPPTLTISTSTGSNGSITLSLANPQSPTFKDSFAVDDYILVTTSGNNFLSTVSNVPYDYQIVTKTAPSFTATNCEVSALVVSASGKVTYSSKGQLTLTDVSGKFTANSKIVGVGGADIVASGATGIIETSNSIKINDKSIDFTKAVQLYQLIGNFSSGSSPFLEDEYITQKSLFNIPPDQKNEVALGYQPSGYVHHIDLTAGDNNDVLYISNKYGIYNNDVRGVRQIVGATSGATLDNLLYKYQGQFVVDSGQVLYYENLDPITRSDNKSEIFKIILEF